jgi:hypothetical protein
MRLIIEEMDKCLQMSLKKNIDKYKININDKIIILYEYPNDRYIQHCYKNNYGEEEFSYEYGKIENMGCYKFEPLKEKLMLKSLCRQTKLHFMFNLVYEYLDVSKLFYKYIDDEITCYDNKDIILYANPKYIDIGRGWEIIKRLYL